ncbi:hypothetical protein [Streptomyces sp. NPDC088789]|uniref:hypothetical protein n=1 Tax=Streptomyces sp. NPDC088789 TaxID=3365899 RepID=UPI0037F63C90
MYVSDLARGSTARVTGCVRGGPPTDGCTPAAGFARGGTALGPYPPSDRLVAGGTDGEGDGEGDREGDGGRRGFLVRP